MLRYLFPCLFLAAIIIAGCGGGIGGGFSPAPATPGPSVTVSPGPSSQSVNLSGAGYKLQFTLPATFSGGGSLTATLQASPPSGVPVPQLKSRAAIVKRQAIGSTVTTLVYLVVQASGTVQFTSVPSFVFTLPSGTSIPSGSPSYVAFYDPTQQGTENGWIGVLGPGTVSGQTDTFAGINSGVTLIGGNSYVYALVYTSQAVPTATPAPTPTPVPITATVPAYCSNYSKWAKSGVRLNVTDNSGLLGKDGAVLLLYSEYTTAGGATYWLNASGSYTSATPVSIPAACFSSTSGTVASLPVLYLPSGIQGWRVYLVYATNPGTSAATAPNPWSGQSAGGPNPGYGNTKWPWDKIEGGTTSGAVIDTTQVDFLGLPLELSVGSTPIPATTPAPSTCATAPPNTVGVTSCGFAAIFTTMAAAQSPYDYNLLVLTEAPSTPGPILDAQVVAPKNAFAFTAFDWKLFYDKLPTNTASCPASTPYGYLSCVLHWYYQNPQLYGTPASLGVSGTSGDNYCVSSDNSSNFYFTDVGAGGTCPSPYPTYMPIASATPTVHQMSVYLFAYGMPPAIDSNPPTPVPTGVSPTPTPGPLGSPNCQNNILFSQPFGNSYVGTTTYNGTPYQHTFATADALAIWKGMTADLNRGEALQSGTHPMGLTNPTMASFWHDPMYNYYAYVVHENFEGNKAYALAYDDTGDWESGVSWSTGDPINIRVNAIPTASAAAPLASPATVPNPTPCPTFTPGVGGTF